MKYQEDWIGKKLSSIISKARYDSQWQNVVDMNIAKKSFELGLEYSTMNDSIKFVSWLCNSKKIYDIIELKKTEIQLYEEYQKYKESKL